MSDFFKEQIVKKNSSIKNNMISYALSGVGGALALVFLFFIPNFGFILAAGVVALVYYYVISQNKEFEYIVTNYDFDIDVIINKSKRKKALAIDIRKIKSMAFSNNTKVQNDFINKKTLDFTSGEIKENTMYILYEINGVDTKIIIEPNDNILDGFKKFLNLRVLDLTK
ncbi:MAG: DUF6106 family protein [Lachnospirales bacterium]